MLGSNPKWAITCPKYFRNGHNFFYMRQNRVFFSVWHYILKLRVGPGFSDRIQAELELKVDKNFGPNSGLRRILCLRRTKI